MYCFVDDDDAFWPQVLKTMDRSNNGSASIHHQFAHFFNGISAQPLPYPVEMVRFPDDSHAFLCPA